MGPWITELLRFCPQAFSEVKVYTDLTSVLQGFSQLSNMTMYPLTVWEQASCDCDKTPEEINLVGKAWTSAHGLRSFNLVFTGAIALGVSLTDSGLCQTRLFATERPGRQRERGRNTASLLCWLLPPSVTVAHHSMRDQCPHRARPIDHIPSFPEKQPAGNELFTVHKFRGKP